MRKWRWLFVIIIIAFSMLYGFAWFFVIPKASVAALPFKWRMVVPGLERSQYQIYLGKPIQETGTDVWTAKNGNYTFTLHIQYNTDSIAENVVLDYTFSNYLFYKKGVIRNMHE